MSSVDVFGQLTPVEYVKDYAEDEGHAGDYDTKLKIITIDKNLDSSERLSTLLHEMGHALFDRIGLTQGVSKEYEETVVESYAKMIVENFNLKLR